MFPNIPAASDSQAAHSVYRGNFQGLVNNVIRCAGASRFLQKVVDDLAPGGVMNFTIIWGRGGTCTHSTRMITLSFSQCECYLTQQLIQEMTNLWFGFLAVPLDQRAHAGDVSRSTYIKLIELMEFGGVRNVVNSFDAVQNAGALGCAQPIDKGLAARPFVRQTTDDTVLQLDLDHQAFNQYFELDFLTGHKENIGRRYDELAKDKGWRHERS